MVAAEGLVVVEEVEAKVHEAAGEGLAVDENVRLGQMPASGTHKELGGVLVELVNSVPSLVMEAYCAVDGVLEIHLPSNQVLPARRQCILKVSLPNYVPLNKTC